MSKSATLGIIGAGVLLGVLVPALAAQTLDWRRIGNSSVDLGLAGLASGPVDRVWYSGERIVVKTSNGRVFETDDLEKWQASSAAAPERGALTRPSGRAYSFGQFVQRSDDGGRHWENVTGFRGASILGDGIRDLAVNPANDDEIVAVGAAGVFRSADGGRSWIGLNQGLPNLAVTRIRALPANGRGTRIELADSSMVEWQPGERTAWKADNNAITIAELSVRQELGTQRGGRVTAIAVGINSEYVYSGMADGAIDVSPDSGRSTWQRFMPRAGGAVNRFWVDASDARVAIATLSAPSGTSRVLRTINGGIFWDDMTADLLDTEVYGVTADRASGAVYIATARGVFYSRTDLSALGPAAPWIRLPGLAEARAMDVQLDAGGNQLWVALEGYGVFATMAPHRLGDPRIVSAADMMSRAAAPGSVMSVAGAKVDVARTGNLNVPVLAATETESQIQIPFDVRGDALAILIDSAGARRQLGPLKLGPTAPGIVVQHDGTPFLLDGDNGVMLDAMHPAHSRSRIQILATGLGSVTPEWPAGVPAPLDNSPRVVAPMKAWIDRQPVEVTRAVLAPGYIGFYLVEIEVPAIVNYGPAELYVEAAGEGSNRVRVYLEP